MTVTVWPIAAVTGAPAYSGRMLRQAQSVFLAGATSTRPLGARSGVRPGTSTTTCTASSVTWSIGPHAGVMDVEVAAECGAYTYANDAAITGAMTAAHATLARVDILWMRVDDPPEDGTSVPQVVGGYTAGTAASTPAAPATPARCMVLAWVNVPASGGGAPTVTWKATYAVAAGVLDPAVSTKTAGSVGPTSAGTALSILTAPSVIGDGVKRFKVTASIRTMAGTVANDFFTLTLVEVASGATVGLFSVAFVNTISGIFSPAITVVASDVPAAGTRTYRLDVARTGGTGTVTATGPMEILVEQIA